MGESWSKKNAALSSSHPPHPVSVRRTNSAPVAIPSSPSPSSDPEPQYTPFTFIDPNKTYLPPASGTAQAKTNAHVTTSLPLPHIAHRHDNIAHAAEGGGMEIGVSLRNEENEWLSINLKTAPPQSKEDGHRTCTYLGMHTFTLNLRGSEESTSTESEHLTAASPGLNTCHMPPEVEGLPEPKRPAIDSQVEDSKRRPKMYSFN